MNGAVNWSCLSLQAWTKITRSEMGGKGGGGNLCDDLILVHRSFLTNLQKTSVLVSSSSSGYLPGYRSHSFLPGTLIQYLLWSQKEVKSSWVWVV